MNTPQVKSDETNPMKSISNNTFLRMMLAGISGIAAQTFIYPIGIVTLMQKSIEKRKPNNGSYSSFFSTAKLIVANEGALGFFKGMQWSYATGLTYNFFRLGLYEPFKKLFWADKKDSIIKNFISASSAGLVSCVAYPVEHLRYLSGLKIERPIGEKESLIHKAKVEYSESGILGFYKGVQITVVNAMLLNGIKLSTYDVIKTNLKNTGYKDEVYLQFLCSLIAGFITASVSAPFYLNEPKRVYSHYEYYNVRIRYKDLFDRLSKTIKNEGFKGLYKGFLPLWGRVGLNTIIQLVTWEQLRKYFGIPSL